MLSPRKLLFYTNKNEVQNYRFRSWLKFHADPEDLDQRFFRLHQELFADYDCSRCRNCCKQYYGSVPKSDIERDATALGMTENDFRKKYLQDQMTEEWLDFIAACRSGTPHPYDIVEGPMADDTIYNYVQGFLDGKYSRETFWSLARFKSPTHQISFHTDRALQTIRFVEGVRVYEE